MKSVLFVCDNFIGGGLETRICEQVQYYRKRRIKTYLICTQYSKSFDGFFDEVIDHISFAPKDYKITGSMVLSNAEFIYNFCKKRHVDFMDIHPFWAFIPAVLAAEKAGIPHSYTLHEPTSDDFVVADDYVYGLIVDTLLRYSNSQIFVVGEYLRNKTNIPIKSSIVINNGTKSSKSAIIHPNNYRWALASRLDQKKGETILHLLDIIDKTNIRVLDIYGDGDFKQKIMDYAKQHVKKVTINFMGWVEDFPKVLREKEYDGVLGMDRVALESLMANMPTVILGYNGIAGAVTADNLSDFLVANLSSTATLDKQKQIDEINKTYHSAKRYKIKKIVEKKLNSKKIWKRYLRVCNSMNFKKSEVTESLVEVFKQYSRENLLFSDVVLDEILKLLSSLEKENSRTILDRLADRLSRHGLSA